MLTHPITFLAGYLVGAFVLSFAAVGPLAVFISMLPHPRLDKRRNRGLYLGAAATAFAFMVLHYLLYLRGYRLGDWSALLHDIFYPPRYF